MNDKVQQDIEVALARMREQFIGKLPERLVALRALVRSVELGEPDAAQTLHRAAHSLVGSAGVHGLKSVSDSARVLEQAAAALPRDQSLGEMGRGSLQAALERLAQAIGQPEDNTVPPPVPRGTAPRVVVVDDDPVQAQWMRSVLESLHYEVVVYGELDAFCNACQQGDVPAVVIMDMIFPEGDEAGAQAIHSLKEQSICSLPVVFVSVRKDMPARLAAYRAGATRYLTKPLSREALLRAVGDTAAFAPREPYRVLMVDDDPEQLSVHAMMLRRAGMEVLEVGDPLQAPQALENFDAEVLVLDMYMPGCSGPELAAVLGDDERYTDIPIVYLSAETNVSLQLVALDRGGDHFLTKPVDARHLVAAVSLHAKRLRQAREQTLALRNSLYERERQQIALNAHAIVSIADASGTIRYVNDKFTEISGYSREELLGANHRVVKSAEHPPAFFVDMWEAISHGKIWQGEVCNQAKDGRLYWVDTTIVPFLDGNGLPYQYISIRTDVTHVVEAQKRLRKIVSRVPGMVYQFQLDPDGKVSFPYASEGVESILDLTPQAVQEDAALAFAVIHPDDLAALNESIQVSARDMVHWRHEFRLKATGVDGQARWLYGDSMPERQSDGAILWHGFITEVTERKRVEHELKLAMEAAEAASRAKSEFLASMSHELRTPLNAIIGFSQIFGMDPRLDQDMREHAKEIEGAGGHLLSLVNGLIDLARVEAGQMEMSIEPVQMGTVLSESLSMVAPIAAKQGISLLPAFEVCEQVQVRGDFVRLRQVAINLLSNAIKYNRPQGSVRLLCEARQGRLRVCVSDTGLGIAADKQDRIFNAFDRLGAERSSIEGTGIGLVLTKRMVEAMGGSIGFDSVQGQGSTFWFEFPVHAMTVPVPPEPEPEPAAVSGQPAVPTRAQRPVVLYVEDNPMNLRLMQHIFAKRKDLELRDAHTAEIGIALARAEPPALILMDINLPGMDGYQALEVLKADPKTAHIPVLAVTANAMKGDEERGRLSGFVDYVSKPLDVSQFVGLLERLLPR